MTASTASPFDQRIATLGRDDLMELLNARHAVRRFTDRPIEGDVRAALEAEVAAVNERYGLSVQLCLDNPGAFDGALARYGSFKNVRNNIALVGPKGPGLDEACGQAGERLVLLAQALGLNTCWVALTYRKRASEAAIASGEKLALTIALGYGETAGAAQKRKEAADLCRVPAELGGVGGAPAWFRAGMEAARVAPTALNQQRFRFELGADGRTVTARALPALSCGMIDLGIARLHFELGANTVSCAWRWA